LVARVGAWGISRQDNRRKQKGQKVAKRAKGLSLAFLLFICFSFGAKESAK
jgi:hypothetical protein